MKILFADKLPETELEPLRNKGHSYTIDQDLNEESLVDAISEAEVLVVRSTVVNKATINAGKELRLIIRAGSGTNTIDIDSATTRGIQVSNIPGGNTAAVAELAIGLIIAIDRNIPDNITDLRNGRWNKKHYSTAKGLLGRNLGIIGFGQIGQAVTARAIAFGINVFVIQNRKRGKSVMEKLDGMGVSQLQDLDALLDLCDIVSLHLPLTPDTKEMVNHSFLQKLKPGTMLINTSRGALIDESALLEAMDKKEIRVGLDVYQDEPLTGTSAIDSALAQHPNTYGTHHIGASTWQAQTAVAEGVIEVIDAFERGETLNCVNCPLS
ncbi:MAG: NAD(P)-dependent oxidoreductase [Arenicellales bacterium]|jgi:D-3-phosphoglycerate dehydrogenase|nr:NAD(P)-dependent oxidoreductase [Arenicellales bacterium]MDP7156301.1 NAD(P)-dependent oxidoreductase [Arenicellales bacterium]|tara:strand:- start:2448 stop:3419 length:972 start_codon:yes stop_codon:yes gene_type:complete